MKDNQQELLKSKQEVIYYRAEASKYKNRISKLEEELEKELIRNNYLQNKVRELNHKNVQLYRNELEQLRKRVLTLEIELEEERAFNETLSKYSLEEGKAPSYFSLFNYSIFLPSEEDTTLRIISDLTIVNVGEVELEDLIVCLKITPVKGVVFSGKIFNPKLLTASENNQHTSVWTYAIEDWKTKVKNDGEYWIMPFHKPNLSSRAQVTFSNFEILVEKNNPGPRVILEAFVYCKNSPAMPSKNKIILTI